MLAEFRGFLAKTSALGLAIGVIIGAALGAVVTSLVNDIIMPPIGLILGGVDFNDLKFVLKGAVGGDPATEVAIRYGAFINTIIAFLVIAFVVWRLSRLFVKPAPEPEPVPMRECPYCLDQIPQAAKKCRACGSEL